MKKLYLIGGPMGVGKTAVCQILKKRLDRAVFLDGDWCWDMDPFVVNEETKAVVLDNICGMLGRFLRSPAFQNVIFCWVMHQQQIIDTILSRVDSRGWKVVLVSLTASPDVLRDRLQADVDAGRRQPDVIPRSLARLPLYPQLNTRLVDTSALTPEEAAEQIASMG